MMSSDKNKSKRIVMLCSDCFSSTTLYNYVSRFYQIDYVIVEGPLRGWTLAKRRIKKLGFLKVMGQMLFRATIPFFLKIISKERILEIKSFYKFDESTIAESSKRRVSTVNDDECINLIKTINPDIILVNGTRIISKRVLESTDAVIINMHTGITPRYRGVHGGYWALANKDPEHCGVTVHLVDKGIDTGRILYQSKIPVTKKDNYFTYPFLQFGEGIPLVKKVIDDIVSANLKPIITTDNISKLWYHPTIWQYLYNNIFRNVK